MSDLGDLNCMIRSANIEDIERLYEIEKASFSYDIFKKSRFKKIINQTFVYEEEEKILGYVIFLRRTNSKKVRLYSIAVDPKHRKQGIGKQLLDYVLDICTNEGRKEIHLEVHEDNKATIALYERLGFEIIDCRDDYYSDGGSAIIMSKKL